MARIIKYIKPIFIIAILIYLFDQGSGWIKGKEIESIAIEMKRFSMYLLYSAVLGFANVWVVERLEHRYSWKQEPKKRAIYGVVGAIVMTMLSLVFLRFVTVVVIYRKSWNYFIENESIYIYIYSFFITMFIVLVFYVIHFYKAITKQTITEQQTIAKTEIAKFETLKSQLDPHFLFNSLNVLTSLIEENPVKAERFTTKLSKVYRYVLEQKTKDLIPLSEELKFAKIYMELMKMRFEDALVFEMPESIPNSNYKIVPLSLQLLLENAVKHNAVSIKNPLKITIKIVDDDLVITNNYSEKKVIKKGTGIGLKNILERYALLTDRKVSIQKTTETFKVSLPLLTQKTSIMKRINNSKEDRYFKAREKVEKMKEFYSHLVSYIGVNIFLVIVNYYSGWDHKWFIYPLIGWGIGIMFHYFEAFGYHPFLNKNWEERKIKELMDEENTERWE